MKPANLGSSIGVSKTRTEKEFLAALDNAFLYDNKVIVEEFIDGREIECSVLGNENPESSVPGEIIVKNEFYSYSAKYIDPNGADLQIPADLPKKLLDEIKKIAIKTFQALCCEGMARVDFFIRNNSEIFVNEVNTIPGFTSISMYPKMWEASGLPYHTLLDKLISLAIDRHKRDSRLGV
jgi:D-alanine-D-alanine ligase